MRSSSGRLASWRGQCRLTVRGEAQRQAARPGPHVRCTFSVARAWRLAVGPASTQTLGSAGNAMPCSCRKSAPCSAPAESQHRSARMEQPRHATPRSQLSATTKPTTSAEASRSGRDCLGSQQQRRGAAVPHGRSELRGKHWPSVSSAGRRNQHWYAYLGDHRGGLNAWHPTVAGAEREAAVAGHEE